MTPAAGGFTVQATARSGGVSHSLARSARAHTVIVIAGTAHPRRAGLFKVALHLTKAGRKLLRHAKTLRLTITAAYTTKPNRVHSTMRVKLARTAAR